MVGALQVVEQRTVVASWKQHIMIQQERKQANKFEIIVRHMEKLFTQEKLQDPLAIDGMLHTVLLMVVKVPYTLESKTWTYEY